MLSLGLSSTVSEPIPFDKPVNRFKPMRWSEGYSRVLVGVGEACDLEQLFVFGAKGFCQSSFACRRG